MSAADFETLEQALHQRYDDIKLPFTPCTVVTVELLEFSDVSVGLSDFFDTPDPQFRLRCPKVKRTHLNSFRTAHIPPNVTKGIVNETFKFIIPKDFPPNEPFPIEITLVDVDVGLDDIIGVQTVDASKLPDDGTVVSKTLIFDKKKGKLNIKINKALRESPDFRYSLGISEEEKAFRKKRIPKVFEAMKKLLGDKAPKNIQETPIVSFVGSGGGYRAFVGMCGAMEALRDAGLLDVFTYNSGLSGSSWYLACAYTMRGIKATEQEKFHATIRDRIKKNLLMDMINPLTVKAYEHHLQKSSRKYCQPYSFVNYFPGYLVGRQMLGAEMSKKLSDIIPYIENAEVPFPLLVALHVKNRMKASQFHAYVERTPYEISLPSYGISVKTVNEGSTWNNGILVKENPEFPIHFTIGMTGCAFSILLNSFLANGGELDNNFLHFIEKERLDGKKKANKNLEETNRAAEIESEDSADDDDDDAVVHDKYQKYTPEEDGDATQTPAATASHHEDKPTTSAPAPSKSQEPHAIRKLIRQTSFFSSRNGVVGRTAKLYNFALGLEKVERFLLNPFKMREHSGEQASVIQAFGVERCEEELSTTKNVISFVDAGVLKNVPTDVVLRPQRGTDVMIVMDFNGYTSDEDFDYAPLLAAAAQAWQCGLEFPDIDFKKITNMPPQDFLIFPSHGHNCPTVLWFTLSNCKFKNLKNYTPKSTAKPPKGDTRKFNDFQVFGKGSAFSTFSFQYSNYHFDQLKELMYHNVTSHIQEIKDALAETVLRKRQGLAEDKA